MEYTILRNGTRMPMLGFGVYQVENTEECRRCVGDAIKTGYRLIDTAAVYLNEEAVGEAIKDSGVPREELFVTSKVWIQDMGYESTLKAFRHSLARLDTDYLDLYLLHMPFGDVFGAWRAMEEVYKSGRARAIGVCNFDKARLADLMCHFDIHPMVNQVETNLFNQQKDMLAFCHRYDIQLEAWSPFAEGKNGMFSNQALKSIGDKYGKTIAQVALRWLLQRGIVTIPKSVHKERMEENFNVFDFAISDEDMAEISMQDGQTPVVGDFSDPDFVTDLCNRKYEI